MPAPRLRLAAALVAVATVTVATATGCSDDDSRPASAPSASRTASATASLSPAATSTPSAPAVPAVPSATGTLDPDVAPSPQAPVGLAGTASQGRLAVSLAPLRAYRATATLPGETSGPALAVRLRLAHTGGTEPVDLTAVQVTVDTGADRAPASPLSGPPRTSLPTSLAPGGRAEAVSTFSVPARAGVVTVTVALSPGEAPLVFRGAAPAQP